MHFLKIFNDVHEFGPHEIKVDWSFDQDSYYLGDNVELRYTKEEDLNEARMRLNKYKLLFGKRFLRGNHELNSIDAPDHIVKDDILMLHGDQLHWSLERSKKYRTTIKQGSNFLHRLWVLLVFGWLGKFIGAFVTKKFLFKAFSLMEAYNCKYLICGHLHPPKLVHYIKNGRHLIVLPRGKNQLTINGDEVLHETIRNRLSLLA